MIGFETREIKLQPEGQTNPSIGPLLMGGARVVLCSHLIGNCIPTQRHRSHHHLSTHRVRADSSSYREIVYTYNIFCNIPSINYCVVHQTVKQSILPNGRNE